MPSRAQVTNQNAQANPVYPLVREVPYQDCTTAAAHFTNQPYTWVLQSTRAHPDWGRYSFLAVAPFLALTITATQQWEWFNPFGLTLPITDNPWQALPELWARFPLQQQPDLPPLQGGVVGMWGYELGHFLETIPSAPNPAGFPSLSLGFYDLLLATDHLQRRSWLLSSGHPHTDPAQRQTYAQARLTWLATQLAEAAPLPALAEILPCTATSTLTTKGYHAAVQRVHEYILAGDIFQVNLAQQFRTPLQEPAFQLYRRLQQCNPAPFAAFGSAPGWAWVSCSPERFLRVQSNGDVQTRPIKGTRPIGKDATQNARWAQELRHSAKDRAENVMIVDLLRNDLSKVCQPHSVQVPALCELEQYTTVQHLVSTVHGRLQPGKTAWDLLQAAFPGGSITGAPKIRAQEIITELEQQARGTYCGCIGYVSFGGAADWNIAIRTISCHGSTAWLGAGGGVVLDSKPTAEYAESLSKASILLAALGAAIPKYGYTD